MSLLENAGRLGVKYPQKLKDVLAQLHNKSEEKPDDNDKNEEEDKK